jgi:hypothetical protein
MASDLALQSNKQSLLMNALIAEGARDLEYVTAKNYPIAAMPEIREIRPRGNTTITSPNNQEVIFDLNKYQYLTSLMIRTAVTKTAGHDNPQGKFYGLTMYEQITIRTMNRVLQTLSDSFIRARTDNLPDEHKMAVLRRALMQVPTTEVVAGVDATSGVTYTPVYSQFFDSPRNYLNLSFLEQLQVTARFNAAGTNGSNVVWDTATPTLMVGSWLPELSYSQMLEAKNYGKLLTMQCYNSMKQIVDVATGTAGTTGSLQTSLQAKLFTNSAVFNIHYALVNKQAISDAGLATTLANIDTVDLQFSGISCFGVLPNSVVNYKKEQTASCNQLVGATTVARVQPDGGTASYTGWSTIPLGLNTVAERGFSTGAVSFSNVNFPTLNLTYPSITAASFQLEVVYEFWNLITINEQGMMLVSASY